MSSKEESVVVYILLNYVVSGLFGKSATLTWRTPLGTDPGLCQWGLPEKGLDSRQMLP